jgi:hypothetical protein
MPESGFKLPVEVETEAGPFWLSFGQGGGRFLPQNTTHPYLATGL